MQLSPNPQIPRRLYPLRRHEEQERLVASRARFKVVPAGRRSGKTERAKRRIVEAALKATWDDARFFAAAPTRDQARSIFWRDLKAMFPRQLVAKISESYLSIDLITGVEVHVVGMDVPERIEGRPWDGGVLDEFANMHSRTFGEHVRPALSDREGWCWLIGVPEGRNHYYDLWKYAKSGEDPDWAAFTWLSSTVLSPKEVAAAKRQLDPLVFEQEYEASFLNFEGRAYYPFNETDHATKPLRQFYSPKQPLIFCFDFNVAPGVAAIVQEIPLPGQYERDASGATLLDRPITGTAVIGEVWIERNSNTPAVCRKLIADWGQHKGIVRCYGDASGGSRGTAQTQGNDWQLIVGEMKAAFGDRLTLRVKAGNPSERARINAVNTRLKNRAGEVHMMVDPAYAKHVVVDFEGVQTLKGGSGEIDKKVDEKLTHLTDAVGYYVEYEFPVATAGRVIKDFPF